MYGIGQDWTPTRYWIVPVGSDLRHAVTTRPGALINGATTTTVCGAEMKVPYATLAYRMPKTALITQRCADCVDVIAQGGEVRHITWDF